MGKGGKRSKDQNGRGKDGLTEEEEKDGEELAREREQRRASHISSPPSPLEVERAREEGGGGSLFYW